jgi:iron complex transport system substrate-binding protein
MSSPDGPRIVSLIPSATEIVAELGLTDRLVGRSHECDHPPGIERLPACTAPAFASDGTSGDIDRQVSARLENALSIYELHRDVLASLAPSHILTQDRCDVCAVTLAEVEAAAREWVGGATKIVSLKPKRLADVWDDIRVVGQALGVDGAPAAARCAERVGAIAERAPRGGRRVVCLEWADPLFCSGGWLPDLVAIAGGAEAIGVAGAEARRIGWDVLAAAEADVIVLMLCGFDLSRAAEDATLLAARPEWRALDAVAAGQVYVTDGSHYFSRPGPRLVESAEILAEILHPGRFDFGHEGHGWRRLVA